MSAKRWVADLSMSRKLYVLSSWACPGDIAGRNVRCTAPGARARIDDIDQQG